jgi:hypothetical protein
VWTYLWINKKTTMSIIGGVGTAYSSFLIASGWVGINIKKLL